MPADPPSEELPRGEPAQTLGSGSGPARDTPRANGGGGHARGGHLRRESNGASLTHPSRPCQGSRPTERRHTQECVWTDAPQRTDGEGVFPGRADSQASGSSGSAPARLSPSEASSSSTSRPTPTTMKLSARLKSGQA